MANSYNSLCDDFYADMFINTELDLPSDRDLILTFFERIQKKFPQMGNFFRRESGDFVLEEDRSNGAYRWSLLELDRVCAGMVNPDNLGEVYELHAEILSLVPYMLGISHLDVDALDLSYTLSFDFQGNQDEVLSEALYGDTPFNRVLDLPAASPIGFGSNLVYSLSEDCRTQLKINVESKTNVYEVRSGNFSSAGPINIVTTVRQYPRPDEKFDSLASYRNQFALLEEIMDDKIIPCFLKPIASAIAHRR